VRSIRISRRRRFGSAEHRAGLHLVAVLGYPSRRGRPCAVCGRPASQRVGRRRAGGHLRRGSPPGVQPRRDRRPRGVPRQPLPPSYRAFLSLDVPGGARRRRSARPGRPPLGPRPGHAAVGARPVRRVRGHQPGDRGRPQHDPPRAAGPRGRRVAGWPDRVHARPGCAGTRRVWHGEAAFLHGGPAGSGARGADEGTCPPRVCRIPRMPAAKGGIVHSAGEHPCRDQARGPRRSKGCPAHGAGDGGRRRPSASGCPREGEHEVIPSIRHGPPARHHAASGGGVGVGHVEGPVGPPA
jgi:hypothetical protein